MTRHVFFSWQADTPTASARDFLRSVLEGACKNISADTTLDEAERELKVDSDTQGVPGQPPVAETILKKIDNAAVVVADMTFTGNRIDGRPTPNPNVLIEYGWALKSLGYGRVLTVMNTFDGKPTRENLPFDLAHMRWPMEYHLAPDAEPAVKAEEERRFAEQMTRALSDSLALVRPVTVPNPPAFAETQAQDGPARFRPPAQALGFKDHSDGIVEEIYLEAGPALWLRLMPALDPQRRFTTQELRRVGGEANYLMPLFSRSGASSYVRSSDGEGMYQVPSGSYLTQRTSTDAVTFAFRTGEIWSIDVAFLALDETHLQYSKIESLLVKATDRFRSFLRRLDLDGPYRWIAGLVGVRGRLLSYSAPPGKSWGPYPGPICAADVIEDSGSIAPDQEPLEALLPFFKRLFEECGIERPDYLEML